VSTISSPSSPSESRLAVHVPIGAAMRRYVVLVILPALLLGGLGVAYGLHRAPTYEATAENVVQALSPSVAQLPGAIQAAQDLASNQSRLIDSDGIAAPLARQLDTTSEYVADHVSATPVPDSTVIRIAADGASADDAIALANGAARAFADYVNAQTTTDAEGQGVLGLYREASAAYRRELAAKQGIDRAGADASPTERLRVAAALDAAQLRRQALAGQYQTVIQSQGTAPSLKPFVVARTATSDRIPTAEMYGFAGAIVGLVIGAALATLLANRRSRRAVAA
jgi:capsular polysaccharide biosynthesis protein